MLRQDVGCVWVLQVRSGQGLVIVQHCLPHLMHQRTHREENDVHGLDESHGTQGPGIWHVVAHTQRSVQAHQGPQANTVILQTA